MGRSALATAILGLGVISACVSVAGSSQSTPAKAALSFDQTKAWEHLVKQCGFGPRFPGSAAHVKCRDFLFAEMKKHVSNVRLQELAHKWSRDGKTYTMWNVLGDQNWADAKVRVVVLAHWDTRPTADMESSPADRAKPIVGANDGASGVAVLLVLMRVMKERAPKDLGILYLLTDGEDLGPELQEMFLGAVHFAKNPGKPKPDYGILLDMIGDKDLSIPMEPNSDYYAQPLLRAFYRHVGTLGLRSTFPQAFGPIIADDHIALNESGIPTIDLIDFSYEPWHTLADTQDKCSADSLGKVGRALESWLSQSPPWAFPAR